jgi:hypothetical protein
MALEYKQLKQGKFTTPQCGDDVIEMYIVENLKDLQHFNKVFDMPKMMTSNLIQSLNEGRVIIANDRTASGYPSYCYESLTKTNPHPSDYYRIKE